MVKNLLALQETWVRFLDWDNPLKRGVATPPVFLPGESHGEMNLSMDRRQRATVHGVTKSWT